MLASTFYFVSSLVPRLVLVEEDNVSQSFNTARAGACVDAMHINEVGGLVPILNIAEFVLYCRLVPDLCTILNYLLSV